MFPEDFKAAVAVGLNSVFATISASDKEIALTLISIGITTNDPAAVVDVNVGLKVCAPGLEVILICWATVRLLVAFVYVVLVDHAAPRVSASPVTVAVLLPKETVPKKILPAATAGVADVKESVVVAAETAVVVTGVPRVSPASGLKMLKVIAGFLVTPPQVMLSVVPLGTRVVTGAENVYKNGVVVTLASIEKVLNPSDAAKVCVLLPDATATSLSPGKRSNG